MSKDYPDPQRWQFSQEFITAVIEGYKKGHEPSCKAYILAKRIVQANEKEDDKVLPELLHELRLTVRGFTLFYVHFLNDLLENETEYLAIIMALFQEYFEDEA